MDYAVDVSQIPAHEFNRSAKLIAFCHIRGDGLYFAAHGLYLDQFSNEPFCPRRRRPSLKYSFPLTGRRTCHAVNQSETSTKIAGEIFGEQQPKITQTASDQISATLF